MRTRAVAGRSRTGSNGHAPRARATGAIASVAHLRPGDHVCWCVSSDDEQWRVLTEYFAAGVRQRDRVVYFTDRYEPATVLAHLADAGLPSEALLSSGQLVVLDARAAYTPDDAFDPARMLDTFRAEAARARTDGYRALRAAGESEWLLPAHVSLADLLVYELRCDVMTASSPVIGLCLYDLRRMDPAHAGAVAAVHAARLGDVQTAFCIHAGPRRSLVLEGEVELADEDRFRDALAAALALGDDPTVLDLSGLELIGVRGMTALASLGRSGRQIHILNAPALVRRCFALLRFDRFPNVVLN